MPNKQINELFWAFVIALAFATTLSLVAYIFPGTDSARSQVFRVADDMVSGALGFFAGRAMAARSNDADKPEPK